MRNVIQAEFTLKELTFAQRANVSEALFEMGCLKATFKNTWEGPRFTGHVLYCMYRLDNLPGNASQMAAVQVFRNKVLAILNDVHAGICTSDRYFVEI